MERNTSKAGWLAGTAVLGTVGLTATIAAADSADLEQQLAELRSANAALAAKVERLEQVAGEDHWLSESRAAEIRAIVTDVLADAQSRESLQASGATAGWSKDQGGFYLASGDGSFKLNVKGQIQVRWAFNHRSNDGLGATAAKENAWGFENRRTKLTLAGTIIDPSWSYEVKPVYNRTPGSVSGGGSFSSGNIVGSVEDVWVQKDYGDGIKWRLGQQKPAFLREEAVSSSAQLAAERSLVSDVFTTKYAQGIQLELGGGSEDRWRAFLYYGDGMRANASSVPSSSTSTAGGYSGSYTTSFNANMVDYAVSGRVEFLGEGKWSAFKALSSAPGSSSAWMVGIGGMAQALRPSNEGTVGASSTDSMWGVTADASFQFDGASLFAYGVYRQVALTGDVATRGGGVSDSMDQWGAVVQAGYFVSPEVELFARYEIGNTDTDKFRTAEPGVELEANSIVTAGMNYYFGGQKSVKWTTDVGFALVPIGDFASSGSDWLSDGSSTAGDGFTNDGQWVVRTQIQLLF